jgi:hypothetical protein
MREFIRAHILRQGAMHGVSAAPAPDTSDDDGMDPVLGKARGALPYVYEPVHTNAVGADRLPYEGVPTGISVGEFAVGVGCFLACATAAGMTPVWMADSDAAALALARQNCPHVPWVAGDMNSIDPADLPWCHVMLGGACCQPFSRAGFQHGFGDDRAYSTLRMLHNVAAVKPWFAVSENVEHMLHVQAGEAWHVINHTFLLLGYVTDVVHVCPSV